MIFENAPTPERKQTLHDNVRLSLYLSRNTDDGAEYSPKNAEEGFASYLARLYDNGEINDTNMSQHEFESLLTVTNQKHHEYITCNEMISTIPLMRGEDSKQVWIDAGRELHEANALNTKCRKPLKHYILSLPPAEHLSNAAWATLCEEFMDKMGFSNTKWYVVKHTDKAHEHVHFSISRIRLGDKKAVPDWQENELAFSIVRELEIKYGLTQLESPGEAPLTSPQNMPSPKQIETEKDKYSAGKSRKKAIQNKIDMAMKNFAEQGYTLNLTEYVMALRHAGVGVQLTQKDNGRIFVSYRIKTNNKDIIISGSKLGGRGRYTFDGFSKHLTTITPVDLKTALKLSSQETAMRDGKIKDILPFRSLKEIAQIKFLERVYFDMQFAVDNRYFSQKLKRAKNYKVHRYDNKRVMSQRFTTRAMKNLGGKMTRDEWLAQVNIKLAKQLIESLRKLFGCDHEELTNVSKDLHYNYAGSESDGIYEYKNNFGLNKNHEAIELSQNKIIDLDAKQMVDETKKSHNQNLNMSILKVVVKDSESNNEPNLVYQI
ncbi:Type IV secretory pathway, VirD2 component [Vibrio mediterranei AK1]|uniref:relaxase/mobilization nuclease domain-containing protein n=1 Tax=Vibrio mediterranei TaxID=689 RepID=UPI0001540F1E|nr:relaxase/mobilization nuclease domain-containing protein [Vibrio mediterranei]EDL53722.1 Type IV secretory pathway, VirD2 component [Vibrio mediterranei AK1]